MDELILTCEEWERLSAPFLNSGNAGHFMSFLAELTKVRVPTGNGVTITKALENVAKLSDAELPEIAKYPGGAPIKARRMLALHRELARLCRGRKYYLSYRDAAKVCEGLSHQEAYVITFAFERLGIVKIVSKGQAKPNGGKAAEFRYLLPPSGDEAKEGDVDFEI